MLQPIQDSQPPITVHLLESRLLLAIEQALYKQTLTMVGVLLAQGALVVALIQFLQ